MLLSEIDDIGKIIILSKMRPSNFITFAISFTCYRTRYDLVFHIRAMRIISSMTTPYARHALRHARVTVEREWRILRSAAKVTVYIVSLVSPREFLIRRNRYLARIYSTRCARVHL